MDRRPAIATPFTPARISLPFCRKNPHCTIDSVMTFRCDHCDLDFASKPDGTGYDQAPCPSCGQLCVTLEFIEQEARRNRLPIPKFTLCTLMLAVAVGCVFLGLSVAFRSYYCAVAYDGYIYGFPFPAVRVPNFGRSFSIDLKPLIVNTIVFLIVFLGISTALNAGMSRMAARRPTPHAR